MKTMCRNDGLDRHFKLVTDEHCDEDSCVGTTLWTHVASSNTFALFPIPPPLPFPEPIDLEAMFPTDNVQGVVMSIG